MVSISLKLILFVNLVLFFQKLSAAESLLCNSHYHGTYLQTIENRILQKFLADPPKSKLGETPYVNYHPKGSIYPIKKSRLILQGSSKECFIFAFLGALESTHWNHFHSSKDLSFSPEFLIVQKLLYTIEGLLELPEKTYYTNANGLLSVRTNTFYDLEGGEFFHILNQISTVGLVPSSVFSSPKVPLINWPFDAIYAEIRQRTEEFKNKNLFKKKSLSPFEWNQLVQSEKEAIYKSVLMPYMGKPLPKVFLYNNKRYTPLSFAEKFGPSNQFPIELIYSNHLRSPYLYDKAIEYLDSWLANITTRTGFQFVKSPADNQGILEKIDENIKNGSAVYVDLDNDPNKSKNQRDYLNEDYSTRPAIGHSFVITNVEKINGEIVAIQLKNSFSNWGENGYAWYTTNEVLSNLRRAWTFKVND